MKLCPFDQLSPECVLNAVESVGFLTDARIFTLNSYENRVFQIGIEDAQPLIAKFYRPERWSSAAIREEHSFLAQLTEHEIPVVAPIQRDGKSLFEHAGYRFALFPRMGGRAPELENPDTLYRIGQLLGQIHKVGASSSFKHREHGSFMKEGYHARNYILEHSPLPKALHHEYAKLTQHLLNEIEAAFSQHKKSIRVHGDCHVGNFLMRDEHLHLVDFDDCRMGPALQDVWMLLSGSPDEQRRQLSELIDGYNEFHDFSLSELRLIEPLRTLRIMQYSAWLMARRHEPAFIHAFPALTQNDYWQNHLKQLHEQLIALEAPTFSWNA